MFKMRLKIILIISGKLRDSLKQYLNTENIRLSIVIVRSNCDCTFLQSAFYSKCSFVLSVTSLFLKYLASLFGLVWFDFCFTALQHILGHFGRGQLT